MKFGKIGIAILLVLVLLLSLAACQSKEAKAADALIAAIGTVDLNSEDAIKAAEDAVAALEQKDRESLKNLDTLTKARDSFEICKVEDVIKAIGTVDLNSEAAIQAARGAYDKLSSALQSRVGNLDVLEKAEGDYLYAVNKSNAEAVDKVIDAIGTVSLDSESLIDAAQKAYDAAPEEVRALVEKADAIQTARDQLTGLRVEEVEKAIAAIGSVTLKSEGLINAAQTAYDAAPEEVRALVKNADAIQTAQDQLTGLRVEEVENAIKAIGAVTLDSESLIDAAQKAYDDALPEIKPLVKNYGDIDKAREELYALKAAEVDAMIEAIGTVTLNSGDAIQAAREAYRALPSEAMEKVTGLAALDEAEGQLQELAKKEADRLLGNMRSEIDQVRGMAFYYSKTQPYYADTRSYALPYIGVNTQKKQVWLCAQLLYTGDDWIFFEKITFAIDDDRRVKTYKYGDWVRDNAYGNVWEYINTGDGDQYMDIFRAIADSKQTIIRFEGDVYYYDLTVSQKDKDAIREVFKAYQALIDAGYEAIG